MSSFVGTGVGETVVFTEAVETGPTNRFQKFSTSTVITEAKAVGFETAVPSSNVAVAGVGIIVVDGAKLEVVFWEAARPASAAIDIKESFMLPFRLLGNLQVRE